MSGSSLYVQSTQYDAAGRLELRLLGADQVRIDPYYRSWDTQGGRMHWLIGRVGSAGAFLQALEYAYDAVGNVSWIKDNLAGGVQTQSFSYDAMDRLLSAGAAPAGDGGDYSESYSYDSAGRLVNGPRGGGYVYGDAGHKHAVTAVSGGHSYAYDANGNLTSRTTSGQSFTLTYDAENRLVSVSGGAAASFVYDGDGRRVKATVNGVTSYYVGDHYEVSGGVVKKYYTAGGQRIALRSGGVLSWLLSDHLGGTAHTVGGTTETGEVRYRAFGTTRFTSGTTPTSYRFTGQREESALGLYYYNARWYDPVLGHFLSPDSIVPAAGNALDYHRYAYTRFNPLKYTDPSGHYSDKALMTHFGCETWACVESHFQEGGSHAGLWGWLNVLLIAEDGDAVEAFVVYDNQTAWVSGQFATQEGKIVVQNPQLRFSAGAPHSSGATWGELTFAKMALMGSWEGYHHAQYNSDRSFTSVYNQRYTDCRHQDCVAQTIDTVGVAGASLMVASPVCGPAVELCASVGGFVNLGATGVGALWTGYQAFKGNTSLADIYMTSTTTATGIAAKNPWINLAASIAQLLWDSQ